MEWRAWTFIKKKNMMKEICSNWSINLQPAKPVSYLHCSCSLIQTGEMYLKNGPPHNYCVYQSLCLCMAHQCVAPTQQTAIIYPYREKLQNSATGRPALHPHLVHVRLLICHTADIKYLPKVVPYQQQPFAKRFLTSQGKECVFYHRLIYYSAPVGMQNTPFM